VIKTGHLLSLAAVAFAVTGCVDRAAQQQAKTTEKLVSDPTQSVTVAQPKVGPMSETREITGQITTAFDSNVGPKTGGKIVAVYVNDGDPVTAGQVIAVQDTTQLLQQKQQALAGLEQARAQVQTALSAVSQAEENAMYGPQKSSAAVRQANAGVRSAQAELKKMLTGARPQERLQAEAAVNSAKSNLETQKKELDRVRTLVQEGALAGTKLDAQQAAYDSAKANYDTAYQSLQLMQVGNRQEDIDAARESLREAQENLKTAQASKSLDTLFAQQVASAKAGLESAKAQVTNAQAQVQIADQALSDAQIRAPFGGKVSGKPIQPGAVLPAGGTVARIIGAGGVYFDGQIPSESETKLKMGDKVDILVDAFPNHTFQGHVVGMNPLGSSFGRQFSVRTQIDGDSSALKPGFFARGEVALRTVSNATIVPLSAVVAKGDQQVVFTVSDNKAHQVAVKTGLTKGDQVQITGLPEGSPVVVKGQNNLVEGTPVKVDGSNAQAANAPGSKEG
jgi:RND family efflux transporter MFP subunit